MRRYIGKLKPWNVILYNEDGVPTTWIVKAGSRGSAFREAWRKYRELPYIDAELPPAWTKAKARKQ